MERSSAGACGGIMRWFEWPLQFLAVLLFPLVMVAGLLRKK